MNAEDDIEFRRHADGWPIMDGEMIGLTFQQAKFLVDAGLAKVMVDQGMAIKFAPAIDISAFSAAKGFMLPIALLAFIPVWIFASFWWALLCPAIAIWSFRSARKDAVIAAARTAMQSQKAFDVLHGNHVIWIKRQ